MSVYRKQKISIRLLDIFDLVSFLIFVMGVVLFIRFFIFNPFTVVGQSMEPEFSQGDFIIVDKITPRLGKLTRGDLIVFVPRNRDVPFIKRIIGLPGETVKINDNNILICTTSDGEETCETLKEYYLPAETATLTNQCKINEFVVDDTGYFVMGDNRGASTDSRCCFGLGCFEHSTYLVQPADIIGKVAIKVYPKLEGHR